MKKLCVALVAAVAVSVALGPLSAQGTGKPQPTPTPTPSPTPAYTPKGEIIQKVIVKVNGEIFAQSELEFLQIQKLRDQQKAVRKAADLSTDPALIAALGAITPDLLVEAVDQLLLVQHGKEMGIKFTDAIFERGLKQLKEGNKIPDDATFQQVLKQEGMTMADLRVNMERSYFMGEVQQRELMNPRTMTLTEEEARQYYNAHPEQFMKPATVTLREIVVSVPAETVQGQVSFSVSVDEQAKKKITDVRERALKGEDFAKLVAEVSDAGSKGSGGIIGPVNVADLSETLADLLAKMKPGDITEPMRNRTGYQIIKLESRVDSQPEPFDKSRNQITQRVLESRLDVETTKFIEKLRGQAVIEWKDEGYKKMYEAARAAHKTITNGK